MNYVLNKIGFSIIIITLIFGLCSCSQNTDVSNTKFEPEKFTLDDLGIYDTISKKLISIGMDRSDLESILGKSDNIEPDRMKGFNYDGLNIAYRDDKVVGLFLQDEDKSNERYKTIRNITIGATKRDVLKAYGAYWQASGSGDYVLLKKDDSLEYIKNYQIEDAKKYDYKNLYFISFMTSLDDETIISHISICDYQYGMSLN